ncbi:MAG: CRISPR-associated helicase/endonuclease Cas3, partial [Betaproteobacteria bacterium]
LFVALERVKYEFPADVNVPTTWEKLALDLAAHDSVLAIVNSRADCRALHALMPEGTIHLSALMCGEHRSQVITEIKQRLKAGESVRVVSTQLVEAGVDMDFPVVYRAMAGLDSIAQAAGRCNREGKLARGKVVVFVPPKPAPIGLLRKAEQATKSLLATGIPTSLRPELFTQYFGLFYGAIDDRRAREIDELLKVDAPTLGCAFRSAAAAFKLIDDQNQRAVYVRYLDSEQWLGMLAMNGPERWLLRKLQRYSVSLSVRTIDEMMNRGDIAPVYRDDFLALTSSALYGKFGVKICSDQPLPANDLVI